MPNSGPNRDRLDIRLTDHGRTVVIKQKRGELSIDRKTVKGKSHTITIAFDESKSRIPGKGSRQKPSIVV
jgi:hypothetical protein